MKSRLPLAVASTVALVALTPINSQAVTSFAPGTASVTPTAVRAASTGNNFSISYTAPSSGGVSGQIVVKFLAGWSTPQSVSSSGMGFVAVELGTCTSASLVSVTTNTNGNSRVTASITCPASTSFHLTYTNVTAPQAGYSRFWTRAKLNGSTGFFPLAIQPAVKVTSGRWSITESLVHVRQAHTATLLPSGKVLVAGGTDGYTEFADSELYDPATGKWSSTGALVSGRESQTATLLGNGKVLVVGGFGGQPVTDVLASAELYDPATGTWSTTGSLATARFLHTATLLPNGTVLVAGGQASDNSVVATAELYHPVTGTWSTVGSMVAGRIHDTATLLPDGDVLVAGGYNMSGFLAAAELYDPASRTWSATASMASARFDHTATLLPNGKVLVVDGSTRSRTAELYDPASGTWTGAASPAVTRLLAVAILVNGRALVVGGDNAHGQLRSAELYDPTTGTWVPAGDMATGRQSHSVTLLPNGDVLVAGGWNIKMGGTISGAELYTP